MCNERELAPHNFISSSRDLLLTSLNRASTRANWVSRSALVPSYIPRGGRNKRVSERVACTGHGSLSINPAQLDFQRFRPIAPRRK